MITALVGLPAAHADAQALQIVVVSNRADLVSDGDALVEVKLPPGTSPANVTVKLNGTSITGQFAVRPNGKYQGLVSGLALGQNSLVATVAGGPSATLPVKNHPRHGPIISGPQAEPFTCRTTDFGLGPVTGPGCMAATRYEFFYKSASSGNFETYNPGSPPPGAQIANTTTDQGITVPYIVRRERGVINRGIYDIAVLFNPAGSWAPWQPQSAWNGKFHWIFRGACDAWHRQNGTVDVFNPPEVPVGDLPLARGFAVATSALNNCNDVLAAETLMMVKEHFVEAYGPVRYTTAVGCSGGSAMNHLTANNYPGLTDGLLTACSIPDVWSLIAREEVDCPLLERYFNNVSPLLWLDRNDRAAVSGMTNDTVCEQWALADALTAGGTWFFGPSVGCTAAPLEIGFEPGWVYNRYINPNGVRCTVQDWQARVFGQRPASVWEPVELQIGRGFANRVIDNTGVQFGYEALLDGQISTVQFVDLNQKVGGRGIDFDWQPQRTKATGLANLYRSGRLNNAQNLDRFPIMDVRAYIGDTEGHRSIHGEMTKARLIAANGHANNLVRWTNPANGTLDVEMVRQAFLTLDQWLAAIKADSSSNPLEIKVMNNKPSQAVDTCWNNGVANNCITPPPTSTPTMQAGGPVSNDVFKCQLKPINFSTDYPGVSFTLSQKIALQAIFPGGVCDWTRPGVDQQPPLAEWMTYASTVGGAPLGPPPVSSSP